MNKIKYFSVIVIFLILAIGSGSDSSENKTTYMDSADITQKEFFEIITKYDSVFKTRSEGNKIQFQEMCDSRNDELKNYFKREEIKKFKVENWVGQVEEIQSLWNGGGLKVLCNSEGSKYSFDGTSFYLNTSNAYDDELLDYTAVKKSSDLYKKLSSLKKGSIIKFSGKFIKSPRYYARSYVISNSEYANENQEYVFQFTEVNEIKIE